MIGMTGGRRLEGIRDLFMYCTLGEIEFCYFFQGNSYLFRGCVTTTVFSLGKSLGFVPYSILFLAPLSLKVKPAWTFIRMGSQDFNGSVFQNAIGDRSFF